MPMQGLLLGEKVEVRAKSAAPPGHSHCVNTRLPGAAATFLAEEAEPFMKGVS